jgi:hypothetical protein
MLQVLKQLQDIVSETGQKVSLVVKDSYYGD